MSAAASDIGLGQPAISSAVAKLEEEFGERLLERGVGGTAASKAGMVVARRVWRLHDQLQLALERVGNGRAQGAAKALRRLTGGQIQGHMAVAETGSFRAAAASLAITEPSLHRAVRDLEQLVGAKLYQRHPGGYSPTATGEALALNFGVALKEIDQARDELSLARGGGGHVAVGCLPLTPKPLLARALAALVAEWPQVNVSVEEASYISLRRRLNAGAIDIIVGALRNRLGDEVVEERLFEDPYVIVARSTRAQGGNGDLHEQFSSALWVAAAAGTPRCEALEALFAELPFRPRVLLQTSSPELSIAALHESDCLALLSRSQLAQERDSLISLGHVPSLTERVVGLTSRVGWLPTRVQDAYRGFLRQSASYYRAGYHRC